MKLISSLFDSNSNPSMLITEAKVLALIEKNNQSLIEVQVERQIGCGQVNCCSNLFNEFFKPNSKLTLPLTKEGEELKKSGYFNEKQKIKLAINQSWLLSLVVSFYLFPLVSFLLAIFLSNQFTTSPILMFVFGLAALFVSLFLVKKWLNFGVHHQLKLIL